MYPFSPTVFINAFNIRAGPQL
jgi:hypothetical protein